MIINITITPSVLEIVAGIPKDITLSSDIPSSIFYTLDGTTPDVTSNIYIGSIAMPGTVSSVTLSVFATNGVDSSSIITQTYSSTLVGNRQTHDTVVGFNDIANNRLNIYPFGDVSQQLPVVYGSMGGITVDAPGVSVIPDGYDGTATGTAPGGTDLPLYQYDVVYSDANSEGQRGHGIGTLPATVTIRVPSTQTQPESSNINDKFFNPKALVIYQDSRDTPIDPNVPQTNRQFSALENSETTRTGALLFNTALEGLQPTGGLVKSHFNANDQTITYYYFDSSVLRWIISKEPYTPKNPNIGNYSQITFSPRSEGVGMVFKWYLFKGSRLI